MVPLIKCISLLLLLFVVGCDCGRSHTRDAAADATSDATVDATPDTTPDALLDARPDGALCGAPVLYDGVLCRSAPDVGFCILAGRQAEAMAMVPDLRCGTALPACDDDSVSCRYIPAGGVCDGMSVIAYNRVICLLWDAGLATDVQPIPLD